MLSGGIGKVAGLVQSDESFASQDAEDKEILLVESSEKVEKSRPCWSPTAASPRPPESPKKDRCSEFDSAAFWKQHSNAAHLFRPPAPYFGVFPLTIS